MKHCLGGLCNKKIFLSDTLPLFEGVHLLFLVNFNWFWIKVDIRGEGICSLENMLSIFLVEKGMLYSDEDNDN